MIEAGAAKIEITPELGVVLAGYGPLQPRAASGVHGRLYATALAIRAHGETSALVAVDLHAAPRAFVEAIAAKVAIPRTRLLVGATHTHCGPGHFYATGFYDWAGASGTPLGAAGDPALLAALAARVAKAVDDAVAALAPATLRYRASVVHDVLWQRSLEAFAANFTDLEAVRAGQDDLDCEAAIADAVEKTARGPQLADLDHLADFAASAAGVPRAEVVAHGVTSANRRAVNPAIDVLSAWRPDGTLVGAWGVLHATPTLMGRASNLFSADVAGEANRLAARRLGGPVGLVGGAIGDVNVLPPGVPVDDVRVVLHDPQRGTASFVGQDAPTAARWKVKAGIRAAASAIADAIVRGANGGADLGDVKVRGAIVEEDIADPASWRPGVAGSQHPNPAGFDADLVGTKPGAKPTFHVRTLAAASSPLVGIGFLSGSNLTHKPALTHSDTDRDPANTVWKTLGGRDLAEGWRKEHTLDAGIPAGDPHAPKLDCVNVKPAKLPRWLPTQALRIEGTKTLVLLGLPGEVTTGLAWRAGQLIAQEGGDLAAPRVIACSLAGQYAGYLGSPREYTRQSYEGAAQWWGRDSGVWVENRALEAARLAKAGATGPRKAGVDPAKSKDAPGRIFRKVKGWTGPIARSGEPSLTARWSAVPFDLHGGTAIAIRLVGQLPTALPDPKSPSPLWSTGPLFRVEVRTDGGVVAPCGDEITLGAWAELVATKPVGKPARARWEILVDLPAEAGWTPGHAAFRWVAGDLTTPWAPLV